MRLFVALVPPPEVVAALPRVPPGVRPVPVTQVHLTLGFLGEQPAVEPVALALAQAAVGRAPVLRLADAGTFGTAVWLGLDGELDRLAELAGSVRDAVRAVGVDLESRPWRPHLTIGRTRIRAGADPPSALASYVGPRAAWTEVRLVRSHLGSGGPRHETHTSWLLDAGREPTSHG